MKVNAGQDFQARTMGGDVAGTTGTSTGTAATTLTDSGASWTTNAFAGHLVVTGAVYGVIVSNTSTALTIDQWSTPGASDAAASTPSTGTYNILAGGAPARYMALSTDSTGPTGTDTSLASEITTSNGGMIRKRATYSHTAGVNSYQLVGIFTANGSDSLPATIQKIGILTSIKSGQLLFETALSSASTVNASGDQLTVTETVTT